MAKIVDNYDSPDAKDENGAVDCMTTPRNEVKSHYNIGDRGPGSGTVFHIDGEKGYEVSDDLGKHTWEEAKRIAESYCGGDFTDWRLPTIEELNFVYQNLWKMGIIKGVARYWSSSKMHHKKFENLFWSQKFSEWFSLGADSINFEHSVRVIRSFSIS